MKLDEVSFNDLPVNEIFQTYLEDYSRLADFYSQPPEAVSRLNSSEDYNTGKVNRERLTELLRQVNESYGAESKTFERIDQLEDPEAKVIVTGQQMIVFGGPLFLIYKALSVLIWARYVEENTGKPVIPVFWLADEDHDVDEVATIALPNGDKIEQLQLDFDPEVRHSIGSDKPVSEAIDSLISKIFEILPETEFSEEIRSLVQSCYDSGNLKEGFARLIVRLFSKHGLVLAESNNPEIKKELSAPICRAVSRSIEINEELESRSAEVETKFHRQAQVQPSTLFMHDPENGRVRLDRTNGRWSTESGGSWSTEELCELAEKEPWRFSPNVFLRPVLQDWLLPTIGYVAGPGEVAYYAQMGKVYPIFDQNMPAILPRYSATIVEPAIQRIMADLPFEMMDYARRIEDLEKEYLEWSTPDDLDQHFSQWQKKIEQLTKERTEVIKKYDPSLEASAEKMTVNFNKSIEKLHQKLRKSLRNTDEIQIKRTHRIKQALFPDNNMQERQISWLYFANKFGLDFWDELLNEWNAEHYYPNKHWLIHP